MAIKRILVANRSEVACRIMRTAKMMGIGVIAIYSDADNNSMHVRMADDAIYVGGSPSTESYLNQKRILEAAKIAGADAVHPGYGFLAENANFANLLENNGINFIGPSSDAIKQMGDKISAKKLAKAAGVSTVPGYTGSIASTASALKLAKKLGYPVMIKAAYGGGGKGMRVVYDEKEMEMVFSLTQTEAKNNFSSGKVFIEKYIECPRHIEVQILADKHGNYVALGERECSIQRHNQKVIEEAPSSFVTEKLRKKMYSQSLALVKKVDYFSAGTIEYIVDKEGNFYFLEMNTRLQVEHSVTEYITGIDIVEQMIKIADDKKLAFSQKDIKLNGWSIESRIYAEDPSVGFLPSTGTIHTYREPPKSESRRIDTGICEGAEVSMFYDAMIAKLSVHAPSRSQAIDLMQDALSQYLILGVTTNIDFLQDIFSNSRFRAGDISTAFISQEYSDGFTGASLTNEQSAVILCSASYIFMEDISRASKISGQLSLSGRAIGTRWVVKIGENNYPVTIRSIDNGYKISFENRRFYITSNWIFGNKLFHCIVNGKAYNVHIDYVEGGFRFNIMGSTVETSVLTPRAAELSKFMKTFEDDTANDEVKTNLTGIVTRVPLTEGDEISKGDLLCVIEAMKMENLVLAPMSGVIKKYNVAVGDTVTKGDKIVLLTPG